MITKEDKKRVEEIKKHLESHVMASKSETDWEDISRIETIERMVANLEIAPRSYKYCTTEDKKNRFYTAGCRKCGWWGSSELLEGGGAIADTGDFSDCFCPVCGSRDIFDKDEFPSTDEAGVIALYCISGLQSKLSASEESFFIAGFQEAFKYFRKNFIDKQPE